MKYSIVYNRYTNAAADAWQMALAVRDPSLDLPHGFYEAELTQIILAQATKPRDEYRQAGLSWSWSCSSRSKRDVPYGQCF